MDADIARRAHLLFTRAYALDSAERTAFLQATCADDSQLRGHIATLLEAVNESRSFLEEPAYARPHGSIGIEPLPPGKMIGNYEIVQVIGFGGMATVYEARQSNPSRTVALKIPRYGWDHEIAIQRFRYESEVLGRLQHPGIAQIYEAVRLGHRCRFFSTLFCDGVHS